MNTLIVEASGGERIDQTAKKAYQLSVEHQCRVDFLHNDQRYSVRLEFDPVAPVGAQFCSNCSGRGLCACEQCEGTGRKDRGGR